MHIKNVGIHLDNIYLVFYHLNKNLYNDYEIIEDFIDSLKKDNNNYNLQNNNVSIIT